MGLKGAAIDSFCRRKFLLAELFLLGEKLNCIKRTWFNSVGEPRMYMNCAPLRINNPETRAWLTYYTSLPDLFAANIGNCKLKEGSDVIFPQADDISPIARSPEQPPEACVSNFSMVLSAGEGHLTSSSAVDYSNALASTPTTTITGLVSGSTDNTHGACSDKQQSTSITTLTFLKIVTTTKRSRLTAENISATSQIKTFVLVTTTSKVCTESIIGTRMPGTSEATSTSAKLCACRTRP
ncbi:hypothetical protein TWF481_002852 [Arthrobotrys musiformis]|uniref:Uncharacterized protein n=1 Tax=Arthrobotrys musiformis TaxID=47236 RepID=A0AAV9VTD1_9PEZI